MNADYKKTEADATPLKLTPEQEDAMVQEAFDEVLQGYLRSNHRKKVEVIERAFRFAREAHKGVRRRSGEPYILHPIAVARIASQEIGLGSTSICAALLHDVVEDTEYTVEDIERAFGAKVAKIVEGLTKISGGIFGDKASAQAENFRKLLLTMSEDIRVVLIKMADRLHNMRTLGAQPPNKQYKIAGETLYIYAPLAHRLGLFAIKTELEDLSFKYEHPAEYDKISAKIRDTDARRKQAFADFAAPICRSLDDMGLVYDAKYRLKSVYSIWRKMETKHIPFEEVYDLYAMRIVFDCDDPAREKAICWNIYSAITDLYKVHPERTRDWIVTPKANGYRALHLTVMGPDGNWVEVQIRSRRMDEIAEKGFAAHWRYKIGEGDEESELNAWLRTIKDILENPEPSAIDFLDTLKLNLFASEIVVFTPTGDVVTLPAGASVLDMAFELHTELGMHCIAGKVNHKLVPLSHRLSSGDQVEVLTSKSQTPQPEWDNYLVTARAKTRLRAAMRKVRQPLIAAGREMLDKWLADNNIEPTPAVMSKLLGSYHAANRDDLYYQLGAEEIMLGDFLVETLHKQESKTDNKKGLLRKFLGFGSKNKGPEPAPETTAEPGKKPGINPKETYALRIDADGNANFRLCDCCNPIPGDDVMGFIADDGAVELHALTCPRAAVLKSAYGPRIVATRWDNPRTRFLVHIHIEGLDRHGILQQLTAMISTHMGIDIRRLEIEATESVFHGDLWVRITDSAVVADLCSRILTIEGVTSAARIK